VIDDVHFDKAGGPMGLTVGPYVVRKRFTFPLVPGQHYVAACLCVLGACSDHGLVGGEDSSIGCKDLAFLLFPSVDGEG
jgi:hypothetical protein